MCRAGGRRCRGGHSNTPENVAARQRLHRARKALRAAAAANDQDALEEAARRYQAAQDSLEATRHPAPASDSTAAAGDVAAMRDYTVTQPGALTLPPGEPVDVRRLSSQTAYTDVVTFSDGTKLIRKDHSRLKNSGEDDIGAYSDAEELAPHVLAAVGLRPAKVRRTGPDEVHVEYVDGQAGEELVPWGADVPADVLDSADGRALGLADLLMANADRNAGNWIRTRDGHLVGIDHGSAFQHAETTTSPFARPDQVVVELDELGQRLHALLPEFERLGRSDWHAAMMRRHNELQQAAGTGT